jgi:hypothetical protein
MAQTKVERIEEVLREAKKEEALDRFLQNPQSCAETAYVNRNKMIRITVPKPQGVNDPPWDQGYVYEVELAVASSPNGKFSDTGTDTSFTSYPHALRFLNGKDETYLDALAEKYGWILEKRQVIRTFNRED